MPPISAAIGATLLLAAHTAAAREISVEYSFPLPRLGECADAADCLPWDVSLPSYAKELHPVVPVRIARILVPEGEVVENVSLAGYAVGAATFHARLAAKQETLTAGVAIHRDVDTYDGGLWPAAWLGAYKVKAFRGLSIVEVPFYPLRVTGDGRAEYIDHAVLTVTTSAAMQLSEPMRRRNGRDLTAAAAGVDNPPDLKVRVVDPNEEIGYLIIGPRALIGDYADTPLQPLIAAKESQNMQVTLAALEDVAPGRDPEAIRDYIRTSYQKLSVDFVLLVGDKGNLPWKYVRSGMGGDGDPVPSDQYYACLDGDFSRPSAIDWACEVAVGRVGARSREDVANWVEKTLTLAERGKTRRNTSFLNFGEVLDNRTLGQRTLEFLVQGREQSPRSVGFPAWVGMTKLYESFRTSYSSDDFIEAMNGGDFHVVNHLGHANGTYVFRTSAAQLSGLRSRPAFFYTEGCYPNDPDTDNWTIRAVRMPDYGPAAMIANTRFGWYAPGSDGEGSSSVLHRTFWSMAFDKGLHTVGEMNHHAKEAMIAADDSSVMIYTALESNLIGDPALDLGL
jgi:hypothetical protein